MSSRERHGVITAVLCAVFAVIGLVALVFTVIEAPSYGWFASRTVIGLALALAALAAFVALELRRSAPLLDPRVLRNRRLSAGSLSIAVQFFAFFGFGHTASLVGPAEISLTKIQPRPPPRR